MKKIVIFTTLCLYFTLPAYADQLVPTSLDILDKQRQEIPAPLATPSPVLEASQEYDSSNDTSQAFLLTNIVIDGNSVLTDEQLLSPFKQYFGQSISYNHLRSMVNEMTHMYREKGYILSRVVLPEQTGSMDGLTVQLKAIEGYIANVRYQGDEKFVEQFQSYFSRAEKKMLAMRPLNYNTLESLLLRVQDVPGLVISTTVEATADGSVGASDLVISVDRKVLSGYLGMNNNGTDSSGPYLLNVGLSASSFPLIGLEANVHYGQATQHEEYSFWQAGLSYQFANGLNLQGNYGQSYSPEPNSEFARLFDYESNSTYFSLGASYPIIRSRDMNLNFSTFYNYRNSDSEFLGSTYTKEKMRNLAFSLDFDFADNFGGVTQVSLGYTRGLDVDNASDFDINSARPSVAAEYNKLNFYLARNQQLGNDFSLFASTVGQTVDSPLFSYDQFSLGGNQYGRGYEPGTINGDLGIALMAELRWTYYAENYTIQPFVFADWGSARYLKTSDFDTNWEDLSSTGAGVNIAGFWNNFPDLSATFYVAKPLKTFEYIDNDDWKANFSFTLSF